MNYAIVDALSQIIKDKEIEKDFLLETVKAGLEMAAKKKLGPDVDIDVEIDFQDGSINVYQCKEIVKRVKDPDMEISLAEARKFVEEPEVGEVVPLELSFFDFGRTAIQTAKQIIIQKLREKEREKIFENYQDRVGEIVTGTIQQIDRGNLIINLGKAEAIVPREEQIRRERFSQGDTIRAYLMRVEMATKGPQIVLSRSHPGFLEELFKMEVPEIYEGIVKIKSIARESGERSKVAVLSMDENIDAVGACVGMKGSRVQDIVRELSGERIDIVSWSSDRRIFVTKALSPAKVVDVILSKESESLLVVVKDENLSQAIGKGGQNAKLASRLTGLKIDIMGESEYEEKLRLEREMEIPITECTDLGNKLIEKLIKFGYDTVQEILEASMDDILEISGIGPKTAEKIFAVAAESLAEREREREREREKEREKEKGRELALAEETEQQGESVSGEEPGGEGNGELAGEGEEEPESEEAITEDEVEEEAGA